MEEISIYVIYEVFKRIDEVLEETRSEIIKKQKCWDEHIKILGTPLKLQLSLPYRANYSKLKDGMNLEAASQLNDEEKTYFKLLDLVVCNSVYDFGSRFKKELAKLLLSQPEPITVMELKKELEDTIKRIHEL